MSDPLHLRARWLVLVLIALAIAWDARAATDCQSYTQGDHNANPTCPAGQIPQWYFSVGGGGGPFPDAGAAANAAADAVGANAYYWNVVRSGGGAFDYVDARAAFIGAGGCPNLVSGGSLGVSHTCAAPTCDEAAGGSLDLPDPLNTANGQTLCVDNCVVTAFVGLGITPKGAAQSGTIAFGLVGSPPASCTTDNVPEPDRARTCFQEGDVTICAYNDNKDAIGDGAIDNPDPTPDTESAADKDDINSSSGGCVTLASGAFFCTVGALDTPDNGNPGQPASPDAVVTGGNGFAGNTTYNYYSSSTVAGSSNHGDGTGNGECDPSKTNCESGGDPDGTCDPETDENCREDGKGTISGGNNCSAPPVCNNDPIQCYHSTRLWELKCALATPSADSLSTAVTQGATDGLLKEDGSPLVDQLGEDFDVSTWWSPGSASSACPPDITITHFLGSAVIPVSDWCSILHAIGFFVLIGAALASFRIFAQGFA